MSPPFCSRGHKQVRFGGRAVGVGGRERHVVGARAIAVSGCRVTPWCTPGAHWVTPGAPSGCGVASTNKSAHSRVAGFGLKESGQRRHAASSKTCQRHHMGRHPRKESARCVRSPPARQARTNLVARGAPGFSVLSVARTSAHKGRESHARALRDHLPCGLGGGGAPRGGGGLVSLLCPPCAGQRQESRSSGANCSSRGISSRLSEVW